MNRFTGDVDLAFQISNCAQNFCDADQFLRIRVRFEMARRHSNITAGLGISVKPILLNLFALARRVRSRYRDTQRRIKENKTPGGEKDLDPPGAELLAWSKIDQANLPFSRGLPSL